MPGFTVYRGGDDYIFEAIKAGLGVRWRTDGRPRPSSIRLSTSGHLCHVWW